MNKRTKVSRNEFVRLSDDTRWLIGQDLKNAAYFEGQEMEWEIAAMENDPKYSWLDIEAKKNYRANLGKNIKSLTYLNEIEYRKLVSDVREMICAELGDVA